MGFFSGIFKAIKKIAPIAVAPIFDKGPIGKIARLVGPYVANSIVPGSGNLVGLGSSLLGGSSKEKSVNGGIARVPVAPKAADPAVAAAAEEERKRLARQGGRAQTIRTSARGVLGDDGSGLATKTLLG